MKFVGNKFNRKIPATPGNVFWLLYFLEEEKNKENCLAMARIPELGGRSPIISKEDAGFMHFY